MRRTLSINQATLMETPTDLFVEAVAGAKFNGLELRTELVDAYLESEGASLGILRELLETGNKLRLVAFNALEDFSLCPDRKYKKEVIPLARKMVEYTHKLESDLIVVVPSFTAREQAGATKERVHEKTRGRLAELAGIAGEYDVRVGFEFLGFPDNSVTTLEAAREVVEPLYYSKNENVGIVVDTFHYTVGGSKAPLTRDDEFLYLLHVNDLPERFSGIVGTARDEDRVLPGTGILDLKGFVGAVDRRVPLSVELFNADLYKRDPGEVAGECYAAISRIVKSVDVDTDVDFLH
ncbi:MAG: sugar phosphate isomerase/epimerase family protein [Promethearchaeota archaeon]